MNLTAMLQELRDERENLEQAILVLERLALGGRKRRGRPPGLMSQVKRRGRPRGYAVSHAARKAQSARMKAYWAKRRREAAKEA